jgi:hypothetical protein
MINLCFNLEQTSLCSINTVINNDVLHILVTMIIKASITLYFMALQMVTIKIRNFII